MITKEALDCNRTSKKKNMPDLSLYKVGIVLSVKECGIAKGKVLKACQINVGDTTSTITVVTSASNVREGSRVAVAPMGSTVLDESGEEMSIQKTVVGGVVSEGMLCDSRMLGWIGGAAGLAVQIPDSIEIGACPPSEKPRVQFEKCEGADLPVVEVKPLFEKKLSKEEKKKLAEEKRKARKAAKEDAYVEGE